MFDDGLTPLTPMSSEAMVWTMQDKWTPVPNVISAIYILWNDRKCQYIFDVFEGTPSEPLVNTSTKQRIDVMWVNFRQPIRNGWW